MPRRKLEIEILGEARGIKAATTQATKDLGGLEGKLNTVGKELGLTNSKAMSLAGVLGAGGALALGAGAAGGALVGFGKYAVDAFQSTALEAGKMADATGLSVEAASRWREVVGDIGVDASALEAAIGRFNKTVAMSPEKVAALGVEVRRLDDGAVDVNETFLSLVDRLNGIADPTERARVASATLGRGWQELAEVIGQGSSELRASLESVSDAKVIDEDELERAREFREATDNLNDAVEELTIAVGEKLVPALADMAEQSADVVGAARPIIGVLDKITRYTPNLRTVAGAWSTLKGVGESEIDTSDWERLFGVMGGDAARDAMTRSAVAFVTDLNTGWQQNAPIVQRATTTNEGLAVALGKVAVAAEGTARRQAEMDQAASLATQALRDQQRELDLLNGELDIADQADRFASATQRVWDALAEGNVKETNAAVRDLKREVLNYEDAIGAIPEEVRTDIVALIDDGKLMEAEARLRIFTRNRTIAVSLELKGGIGTGLSGMIGGDRQFDSGGVVPGRRGSPQLIMAHGGETIIPTHKGTWMAPSASSPTVIQLVLDGRVLTEVVHEGLLRERGRSGPLGL